MSATLAAAIERTFHEFPDRSHVFQDLQGTETRLSFAEIDRASLVRAASLQALGLRKGDRFGLIVVEPRDFVITFVGALRVGIVPVPLYPPLSFGSLDAYAERTERILASCQARILVASGSLENVLWGLVDRVPSLERLVRVEALANPVAGDLDRPAIGADDIAFLQYTSGSTADPKGVIVTHENLVANCEAIVRALGIDGRHDVGVTWLPLYHDMGLIGCTLTPFAHAIPMVFVPTLRFVKRPLVWLDAIHAHKGTATFGPNFAYALVAKKARPQDLVRWDLSRLRLCGCGAEPIHADTARLFAETFAPCGLSDSAFTPAYGLAEATLALTFKPPGAPMRTRSAADAVHVSCGRVVPGHAIEVRDENGLPLPDGVEGELCFRGPSICPGYFGNPKATAQTVVEGWLRTGDLGYVLDGEVYVTGRMKDLVILHGRNIHPQAIEWVAQEVEGVRKGNVVAFSRPGAHSEELVIALETRSTDPDAVAAAVRAAVQRDIGTAVADVVVLPTGALPKTSSGKLQRRLTRAQYIAGSLGREGVRTPGASDRITLARHVARSVWTRAKAAVLWR